MNESKIEEPAGRPRWTAGNTTVELKPQAMRPAPRLVADARSVKPVISSDQLAARVTIRRISRGRSHRRYVMLLGHRSEGTGISRRACESQLGVSV